MPEAPTSLRIDEFGVPAPRIGRSAHRRISPAARGSCGAEGDLQRQLQS
jgi:hypothetical protein